MPLAESGADERGYGAGRYPGEIAQQGAVVEEVGSEPLGYGEHYLAVRHLGQQALFQPDAPQRQALGMTSRAEVAALAREREQEFVPAGAATHPREAVLEDAAARYFSTTRATTGRQ